MALLDETDIEILHSLQKDAKINAKELSEKLHISKTPIYERIKRLENEGYIKGYVPGVRENGGQYTHEYCSCGQFLKILILLHIYYEKVP